MPCGDRHQGRTQKRRGTGSGNPRARQLPWRSSSAPLSGYTAHCILLVQPPTEAANNHLLLRRRRTFIGEGRRTAHNIGLLHHAQHTMLTSSPDTGSRQRVSTRGDGIRATRAASRPTQGSRSSTRLGSGAFLSSPRARQDRYRGGERNLRSVQGLPRIRSSRIMP